MKLLRMHRKERVDNVNLEMSAVEMSTIRESD